MWELAEDESGWSVDYNGNTIVLRSSDANLEMVEGKRHVLITKNSEGAPLGDLLMETCPMPTPPMPADPRELARTLLNYGDNRRAEDKGMTLKEYRQWRRDNGGKVL